MIDQGIDLLQLKGLIVRPSLAALGLDSPAAVNLLTGTALAESGCRFLHQIDGPALGLWQMEPASYEDCWENFLRFPAQSRLATALHRMVAADIPPTEQLVTNLRYACAMARVRYYRSPYALPDADDAEALSSYWKKNYNTSLGAGVLSAGLTSRFQEAINA